MEKQVLRPTLRFRVTVSELNTSEALHSRLASIPRHDIELLRLAELGIKAEAALFSNPDMLQQALNYVALVGALPRTQAASELPVAPTQTAALVPVQDTVATTPTADQLSQRSLEAFAQSQGIDASYFDGPTDLTL